MASSFSLVSGAELVRWLAVCENDEDKALAVEILGYTYEPVKTHVTASQPEEAFLSEFRTADNSRTEAGSASEQQESMPDERFAVLHSREQDQFPNDLADGLPECLQGVEPFAESDEDLQAFAHSKPLTHHSLISKQRLLPFLRRELVYSLGKRLDVSKLVKKVARLEVLHRIPRKSHLFPAGRIYVLLDLNRRMRPFWQDAHELCELLSRKLGKNGLDIRILEERPGGCYSDWFDDEQILQEWKPIKSPAAVLILSDLGGLARNKRSINLSWLRFIQQLRRKNIHPVVLSPCIQNVYRDFYQQVDWVHWGRNSRLKVQERCFDNPDFSSYVERVLGLLSVAVHVEPVLLRAVLKLLPLHEADSDVEAVVYFHEDVQWGHTAIAIKPEKREKYRALFQEDDKNLQYQVLKLVHQHHIGQFPMVWASTLLNAEPLVKFDLTDLPDADIEHATKLMQRFTRSLVGQQEHQGMLQFARRELQRLGTDKAGQAIGQQAYSSFLHGLAYRDQLKAGATIPAKYDESLVISAINEPGERKPYRVVQRGEFLLIEPVNNGELYETPLQAGCPVALLSTRLSVVKVQCDHGAWKTYALDRNKILCDLTQATEVVLDTEFERFFIIQVTKPSWAHEIKRSLTALEATLYFAGQAHTADFGETSSHWLFGPETPEQANLVGFDQYGLYADLTIKGITQRFRWIEPGTFMMGSPEEEEGRWEDEDLHSVTLTQGFWLADTTVTQAFWEAIMGENPSHFRGADRPVDNISWDDCQQFIQRLNEQFSGLQARLPTEAQWEYACRAGTQTPFFFGGKGDLDLKQVNYSGQWDDIDINGETKPVKSYPPNAWGLYEMHGNVYEWCQDVWQGNLGREAVIDPAGHSAESQDQDQAARRVIRGGAWCDLGRNCRSAYRGWYVPVYRGDDIGFRLSLGHELRGADAPTSGARHS